MNKFGPAEKVYVESGWYDGPRLGVADIEGVPHRFISLFDEIEDQYLGTFYVWPIVASDLALEIEQWQIFVSWNALYEAGKETVESHPGHGGISDRWDEIEVQLKSSRDDIPNDARKARAELESIDNVDRYSKSGPDYRMCWLIVES